ncbi:MAG: DHH family phosphoesterase [Candidatus Saccharimonadales bacterium]|jgi:phosphoesterase RecJ-like protein|nr:DHH family phosphoesterase [Candidatus Saccharibacteria bacterium]
MQEKIREAIEAAQKIVVIQADNPDADSLGSALALEHILGDLGKDIILYCGVNVPEYLRYLAGWDRVVDTLPSQFDLSIIVDASTYTLLDKLDKSRQLAWVKSKPCIVLDHHATVEKKIDFTALQIIDEHVASTGELIFHLSISLGWAVSSEAAEHIMTSILGDTQGLMNDLTTATTYRTMADLTELGANRPRLEELRREYGKMPEKIYSYKGTLIGRTEFYINGTVALVHIPQREINEYSPLYNPAPLIQFDMLQVRGVALAIVIKSYDDGRVTAALRANNGHPVAAKLAEHMGGGGHDYAAGFKVTDGRSYDEVKTECIRFASDLLQTTHGDIA